MNPAGPTGCATYAGTVTTGETMEPMRVLTLAPSETGTLRNQYCPIHETTPLTTTWSFTSTSIASLTPSVMPRTLAVPLPVRTTLMESVVARVDSRASDVGRVSPNEISATRRRAAQITRSRHSNERTLGRRTSSSTRGPKRTLNRWGESVTTIAPPPAHR